jgi:hypothetical protein
VPINPSVGEGETEREGERERELAVITPVLIAFDSVTRQAGDLYEALVTEKEIPELMLGEFSLAPRKMKQSC